MDDAAATASLTRLLAERPSALQIITAVPDPDRDTEDPRDPLFNVLEPVATFEVQENGLIMAIGSDGACTLGTPLAVLVRLTEWQFYDPAAPETTRATTLDALEAGF